MPVSSATLHLFLAFLGAFLGFLLGLARGLFLRFSCVFSGLLRWPVRFSCIFRSFLRFGTLSSYFLFSVFCSSLRMLNCIWFWQTCCGDLPKSTFSAKIGTFRPDPGPELPGDLSKRTFSAKISTFRPDLGPELLGDLPKRTF